MEKKNIENMRHTSKFKNIVKNFSEKLTNLFNINDGEKININDLIKNESIRNKPIIEIEEDEKLIIGLDENNVPTIKFETADKSTNNKKNKKSKLEQMEEKQIEKLQKLISELIKEIKYKISNVVDILWDDNMQKKGEFIYAELIELNQYIKKMYTKFNNTSKSQEIASYLLEYYKNLLYRNNSHINEVFKSISNDETINPLDRGFCKHQIEQISKLLVITYDDIQAGRLYV